jgi:hypothetical protein
MLTNELEYILNGSFHRARSERHEFLTVEHLLLAILDAPTVQRILRACGADISKLEGELQGHIDRETPRLEESADREVQPTLGFQRVLQRAVFHVQTSGKKDVGVTNVLVAVFSEKQSHAVFLLNRQRVTRLDVVDYIANGVAFRNPSITSPLKEKDAENDVAALDLVEGSALDSRLETSSPKLFISYSHIDQQCLERLLVHLRPLHRSNSVVCWSDKSIRSGDKWRKEIKTNIEEAAIAILLVSADFLASDFIVNNELPPLLMGAEARGIRILPVILKPCGFHRDPVLSNFQCTNDPAVPLLGLSHIEQEAMYNRIADEVAEEILSRAKRAQH